MTRIIISAFLLFLLNTPLAAQTFMGESGTAEFTSKVPLHTFTGSSDYLIGQVNLVENTVDFYIDLTTLKTGNKKRDKDMLITLETKEYPFAEFFGNIETEFDASNSAEQPVKVAGEFKIHGVTRKIDVDGTLQVTPEGLNVQAEWQLNLKDYNIVPPKLLVVKVDEVQDIKINAVLAPVNN